MVGCLVGWLAVFFFLVTADLHNVSLKFDSNNEYGVPSVLVDEDDGRMAVVVDHYLQSKII